MAIIKRIRLLDPHGFTLGVNITYIISRQIFAYLEKGAKLLALDLFYMIYSVICGLFIIPNMVRPNSRLLSKVSRKNKPGDEDPKEKNFGWMSHMCVKAHIQIASC